MNRATVIIVATCASVGGLALVILVLFLRRRRSSAPLPPIQPLAHEREQYMMPSQEPLVVSRHPSFFTDSPDNMSARSALLMVPNPPFRSSPSRSSSSVESAASSESDGTQPRRYPTSASRSSSRRASRLRPQSIISSTTSHRSTRSVGVPHAPGNRIQIVLPAPLAPDVRQFMQGGPSNVVKLNRSPSLADKWTPAVHRYTSETLCVPGHSTSSAPPAPSRTSPSWGDPESIGRLALPPSSNPTLPTTPHSSPNTLKRSKSQSEL